MNLTFDEIVHLTLRARAAAAAQGHTGAHRAATASGEPTGAKKSEIEVKDSEKDCLVRHLESIIRKLKEELSVKKSEIEEKDRTLQKYVDAYRVHMDAVRSVHPAPADGR